ncbi:hypothetical protein [Aureispira anguillae]|uniref:Uncharacterized protein n=1 Tax=Aureispira anguillae TaxID=2864201 RepID=A0A916DT62_9BACT|nr:hypothetical protein [Aureispira anguillae]BDS12999.1 hypothetical protein AsAng_0037270 [Aureispira anguillae]
MKTITKTIVEEEGEITKSVSLSSYLEKIEVSLKEDSLELTCFEIDDYGEELLKYKASVSLDVFQKLEQAINAHLLAEK